MNQEKGILIIDSMKTEELGLKIVVAKNNSTAESFAVIIEVNPIGNCYKEHVEPGDILISINGKCIDCYETLNNFVAKESENRGLCQPIQLKIQKKGAFTNLGLFAMCLNSPCTEFCKIMENSRRRTSKETIEIKYETKRKNDKPSVSKLFSIDQSPYIKKMPSTINDESVKSELIMNTNVPKYILHQKALPMKRKDIGSKSYKSTIKPKKESQSHIVQPPQPTFIKRRNNQPIDSIPKTNLMASKSLTDLTDISNKKDSQRQSCTSSLSSSSNENIECQKVYKPKLPIKSPMVINSSPFKDPSADKTFNLKTMKSLSKSTDMLMIDLKQELINIRSNKPPPEIWKRICTFHKDDDNEHISPVISRNPCCD